MPVGIYIQVPFCQTKCTYCNFHTGVVSQDRYEPYASAVCSEIATVPAWAPGLATQTVDTVYLGGGTPSLLDPAALDRILRALRDTFPMREAEITLEADPETVARRKADAWLSSGFNRISLGAQSFHDIELRSSGRMHRRKDIFNAVETLRGSGFGNISLDLIAGLPRQTSESWNASVDELLKLRPQHVSIYLLEIDDGSRLGRESLDGGSRYSATEIPSDDDMAEFYESACARLAEAGYDHYEISNWALPGRRSRHNLKYWRRDPYLGLGAGAHSFDGKSRWANAHDSARYAALIEQAASPREGCAEVTSEEAFDEELFLGLRQLEGINLADVERRTPPSLASRMVRVRERLADLNSQGLVEFDGSRLRLARARLTVSNEVLVELLG